MSAELRAAITSTVHGWGGGSALRCLALAYRELPPDGPAATHADESGLTFVGLVGLHDPPRPEAREAVASCHSAGIRVVMLTGAAPQRLGGDSYALRATAARTHALRATAARTHALRATAAATHAAARDHLQTAVAARGAHSVTA